MPEGLEAEIYRRAATATIGRTVRSVVVDERQEAADPLRSELPGRRIESVDRFGKVVVVRTDGADLGLHFGMTGRLIVDDRAAIDQLAYSSGRDAGEWDRLVVDFVEGGSLRVNDPRRWARFDLDPDLSRLGPDVLSLTSVDDDRLHDAVAVGLRGRRALKAVLLDQSRLAGLGNMTADEILFQAGVAPTAPAAEVSEDGIDRIVETIRTHLPAMLDRGGSHTGELDPDRRSELGPCPRDGAPLVRAVVGGRSTVWCPAHQGDRRTDDRRSSGA